MDAIAKELAAHGDLHKALRSLMRRGMQGERGSSLQGIGKMIERLKQQGADRLARYDLAALTDDVKKRLAALLQQERNAWDHLQKAIVTPDEMSRPPAQADQLTSYCHLGDPSPCPSSQEPLLGVEDRRGQWLAALPVDASECVKALCKYAFVNPEAQQEFQTLTVMLKQHALCNPLCELEQRIASMTPTEIGCLRKMLRALNQMLDQQVWDEASDFAGFKQRYDGLLGVKLPQSREELTQQLAVRMAPMQSLLNSLPADRRQALQALLRVACEDELLARELVTLQANLDFLAAAECPTYEFAGLEGVSLDEAIRLIKELQTIDVLQEQLANVGSQGASLQDVDAEALEGILGPEARWELETLRALPELLTMAGYVKRQDNLRLSSRGVYKVGLKMLQEVFSRSQRIRPGIHGPGRRSLGVEAVQDTKPYEADDHFHLDLQRSLMNAVRRQGKGTPVAIQADDFEVFRTDNVSPYATVLALDQSRSMGLNGCFEAAKQVTLALYSLLKLHYPRGALYKYLSKSNLVEAYPIVKTKKSEN
jgi:uncharacterized protein with von Willebrand factor type A (vWA) domain